MSANFFQFYYAPNSDANPQPFIYSYLLPSIDYVSIFHLVDFILLGWEKTKTNCTLRDIAVTSGVPHDSNLDPYSSLY